MTEVIFSLVFSLFKIDDSAISHFLGSRFLQILTKRALRFKFCSSLLMHGILGVVGCTKHFTIPKKYDICRRSTLIFR
jgi:hypothetical protein